MNRMVPFFLWVFELDDITKDFAPGSARARITFIAKGNWSLFRVRILDYMTNLQFKGSWNELKGKLKQKYGQLTDDDLAFADGKQDELLGRLQQKLGKSKEDLRKEIESL
jgi:uncharacterized protein YjbJ (UPF0337 family)